MSKFINFGLLLPNCFNYSVRVKDISENHEHYPRFCYFLDFFLCLKKYIFLDMGGFCLLTTDIDS